ncbi:cytidine deaminase [Pseudooceanicola sp. C21-150M6]|uniref:cytidine deaminase n=1 Tax=Pseudooceanicola sp. C21-150M6 TaxID=3434355 RepID=UPI003D7F644B
MDLMQAAREVWDNAYAPYSNFKVGAAIRTSSGAIFTGVNVENVAYPEGTCAEAGAIAAMCAAGEREIAEVAVIADSPAPVPCCGGCRQKLAEFAGPDVMVTLGTLGGERLQLTVAQILPGKFDAGFMEKS